MKKIVRFAFALIFVCVVATSVGCMRVKPWQRGDLARQAMQFDPDPQRTALQSHIQFSKEASMPGTSAGGGGCGCN